MTGCLPVALAVTIDIIGNTTAVFELRPSQIFAPGSFSRNASLGRGEIGSVIKVAPTAEGPVDLDGFVGDSEGNGWGDIWVSCNSVLPPGSLGSGSRSRIGPDTTAGV